MMSIFTVFRATSLGSSVAFLSLLPFSLSIRLQVDGSEYTNLRDVDEMAERDQLSRNTSQSNITSSSARLSNSSGSIMTTAEGSSADPDSLSPCSPGRRAAAVGRNSKGGGCTSLISSNSLPTVSKKNAKKMGLLALALVAGGGALSRGVVVNFPPVLTMARSALPQARRPAAKSSAPSSAPQSPLGGGGPPTATLLNTGSPSNAFAASLGLPVESGHAIALSPPRAPAPPPVAATPSQMAWHNSDSGEPFFTPYKEGEPKENMCTLHSQKDYNTWYGTGKTQGRKQFKKMTSCFQTCLADKKCSTECFVENPDPKGSPDRAEYTPQCAECFGSFGECNRNNCWQQCIINSASAGCHQCSKANCVPNFLKCTGFKPSDWMSHDELVMEGFIKGEEAS